MVFKVKDIRKYSNIFYEKHYDLLSDFQKQKIDRLKLDDDKKLSLLGMILVSEMLNVSIGDIKYIDGKPTIRDLYFSISHKYPFVGVTVSSRPVGIDIETIREVESSVIHYLKAKDSFDVLVKWTRKESLFKTDIKYNFRYRMFIIDKKFILTICEEI